MTTIPEAIREWIWWVGQERTDQEYILSDYDTWERNPHYTGAPGRHPEDPGPDCWDDGSPVEDDPRTVPATKWNDGAPITEDPYAGKWSRS